MPLPPVGVARPEAGGEIPPPGRKTMHLLEASPAQVSKRTAPPTLSSLPPCFQKWLLGESVTSPRVGSPASCTPLPSLPEGVVRSALSRKLLRWIMLLGFMPTMTTTLVLVLIASSLATARI